MAAPALRPITNSQYKVSISNVPGGPHFFTTFSGIKDNAQTSTYADGQSNIIYNLRGPRQLQQVTMSVPFDPTEHKVLVEWWKLYTCEPVTIQIDVVDCNGTIETGSRQFQITITDAQVVQLNFAQVDRTSSNVSMLEFAFIAHEFTIN